MAPLLSVERLTKRYGSVTAVEELSFAVRPGLVTGLVGPNGSGKSTTMRCALGLVTPTSGRVLVDGGVYRALDRPLTRLGALLDAGAVNEAMTGRRHLRWLAASNGISDERADELLDEVGLSDVARRRIGGYSLGMKQRLGIAASLLGDPPILLFDEPINGLDPEGIVWLRGFVRDRTREGRTVLLSSHLMSELEGIADRLVIIKRGRLVADTTVAELLQRSAPGLVRVRTRSAADAMAALANGGARVTSTGLDTIEVDGLSPERVAEVLAGAGLGFHGLIAGHPSLESIYLELTR
jgi:ABC-2 type transport system ATP-binding protein